MLFALNNAMNVKFLFLCMHAIAVYYVSISFSPSSTCKIIISGILVNRLTHETFHLRHRLLQINSK